MFRLFFLSLCVSFAFAQDWKKLHLINGCAIFNFAGEQVRVVPGGMCQFFPDGRFVAANPTEILMYDKGQKVLWKIDGHFHHLLTLSNDKKSILALSSDVIPYEGNKIRADKLMVISLEGKILHEVNSEHLVKQVGIRIKHPLYDQPVRDQLKVTEELTHFNSFYEIPRLTTKNLPAYLKEGNYVVNGRENGLFILSPDLQKVLHYSFLKQSEGHRVHDVQVLTNGNFLLLNNVIKGYSHEQPQSAIQEFDPCLKNIVSEFKASPGPMFYSFSGGSVQALNDDIWLFSSVVSGSYVYSKSRNEILYASHHTHLISGPFPWPTLQVRAEDLTLFLKNNK